MYSEKTDSSNIEQIISDYYRLLKVRDRDGLLALLDKDIEVTYHGQPSQLPWAGKFHGIAGFDQFFSIIRTYLDVVEVTVIDSISDRNKVINQCQGSWKYKENDYLVQGGMVNVFTVESDKIVGYDVYADTAAFAAGFPE